MKWLGIACILAALASHVTAAPQKMQVSFTGYNKAETLTNFPALVVFSNGMAGGFSYTNFISTNGYDLRLYAADAVTPLNYEIESWSTAAASYVWVQVPTLTSNSYIWAKWGDTAQTNQLATCTNGATWSSDFAAVYHMTETNGLAQDSTTNKFSATSVANASQITATNGLSNGGLNFALSGTNTAYIVTTASTALDYTNNMTMSVWANATPYNHGAAEYASAMGTFTDVNIGWVFARRSTSGNVMVFDSAAWRDSQVAWPTGRWAQVTYVKNGTNGYVYIDGAQASVIFQVASNKASVNPMYIAGGGPGRVGTNNVWKGGLDEIRIAPVTASSNWIWATYQNAASNSAFLAAGTVAADTWQQGVIPLSLANGWWIMLGTNQAAPAYQPPKFANSSLYYTFDSFTNSSGAIIDYSALGTNTGTPTGVAYVPATGSTSAWVAIYNAAYNTSNIVVNSSQSLVHTNKLTVSCWIKQASQLTAQAVLARGSSTGSPFSYSFSFDNSTPGALRWITSFGGALKVVTSPAMPVGWTHVAGVYDGATLSLYTNAVSCGTPINFTGSIDTNNINLVIGSYYNFGNNQLVQVDNVYVVTGDYWTAVDCTNDFLATKGAHGL